MYFDTKKVADKACTRGRRQGYRVRVEKAAEELPRRWEVSFEGETPLDLSALIAADDFFQAVAAELDGEFHGLAALD
jgi:hypothetical protein